MVASHEEEVMTEKERVDIIVMADVKGRFFFAFGCRKLPCSVIGTRHYKTRAGAKRGAEAILRRLT